MWRGSDCCFLLLCSLFLHPLLPNSRINWVTGVLNPPFSLASAWGLAFWHLSCRRPAPRGVQSTWRSDPGPPSVGPPMPSGGYVLTKASDLQLWSSRCLKNINSLVSILWIIQGFSHPPTPLARSLDTLLQAAEGKQLWGGGACTEVSGKGGAP